MITGAIGVIFLGISMIYSGSLVSGNQMRANFATESVEDRESRKKIMFRTAIIGLPNFIIAIILYIYLN
ncbi:DUF5316 family protein [Bacillus pinisoli]|uniref:DUF5316 family protein n=1 Tax=Bacillus pinisoli TaxID=2901866 RepID=UPI002342D888|nr:DUF5316 family protein [Bacillus pinisoli]